jgi:DNA-binding MarR family transcriptional regulator
MSGLQQEIKRREPFECPYQEAVLNLFRTSDRLSHRLSQLFAEYGLTGPQYNILRILRGEGKPLPCLEIAQRTITVVPGITGLIDRLEQKGLVQRQRCAKDRRVIYVSLSPLGEKMLQQLDQPVVALCKQLLSLLSEQEVHELSRLLEKARALTSSQRITPHTENSSYEDALNPH